MARKTPSTAEERIISVLHARRRQTLIVLAIPSHNKTGNELNDQDRWANEALDLFAELYGGATAFATFAGIYKDDSGNIHRDKPIMIEGYALQADVENEGNLQRLCDFIRRMGKETRQKAVALVIDNVFHEITDFKPSGRKAGGA
jgi:hypothetical protein